MYPGVYNFSDEGYETSGTLKIEYVPPLSTDKLKAIICDKITAVRNLKLILRNLGHENLVSIAGKEGASEDPRELNGPQEGADIGQLVTVEDPDSTERSIVLPGDAFIHTNIDNLHIILRRESQEEFEEGANDLHSTVTQDGVMRTKTVTQPSHRFLHPCLEKIHLIFNR